MNFVNLQDKVVVITGASSGIGKLAVEAFLECGANVVLAARSEEAMRQHVAELGMDDNRALVVKTDVSDPYQVRHLADVAKSHFHAIDVWINNAAVSLYGPVRMVDADEMSRVVDVNLKGTLYGARYALEVFSEQHYGNLINVSSVLGEAGMPLQSAYVASKYGIVGFTQALREELLAGPYPDISASVVLPGSMDTPFFTHARSKLEQKPKPIPPVYHPIKMVEALVRCAANPKPEVVVDGMNPVMIAANRLMPRVFERTMTKQGIEQQVSEFPDNQQDNLFEPMPGTQSVRGEYGTSVENLKTYAKTHPFQTALVLSLPTLLLINTLRRNGGQAHQAEFQERPEACLIH